MKPWIGKEMGSMKSNPIQFRKVKWKRGETYTVLSILGTRVWSLRHGSEDETSRGCVGENDQVIPSHRASKSLWRWFFSKGLRTGGCLGNRRGIQRGTNYSCVNVSRIQPERGAWRKQCIKSWGVEQERRHFVTSAFWVTRGWTLTWDIPTLLEDTPKWLMRCHQQRRRNVLLLLPYYYHTIIILNSKWGVRSCSLLKGDVTWSLL